MTSVCQRVKEKKMSGAVNSRTSVSQEQGLQATCVSREQYLCGWFECTVSRSKEESKLFLGCWKSHWGCSFIHKWCKSNLDILRVIGRVIFLLVVVQICVHVFIPHRLIKHRVYHSSDATRLFSQGHDYSHKTSLCKRSDVSSTMYRVNTPKVKT